MCRLLGCVQVKRHCGSGALRDAIAKVLLELTVGYHGHKYMYAMLDTKREESF